MTLDSRNGWLARCSIELYALELGTMQERRLYASADRGGAPVGY